MFDSSSKRCIYLTGFMASGKSTVGPLVANHLKWHFSDLDERIEQEEGKSVERIFEEDGEEVFREAEAAALQQSFDETDCVIATGGGTLARKDAMEAALQNGWVVFLDAPPEELARRIASGETERPLMTDDKGEPLDEQAIAERAKVLLEEREPYYLKSHFRVDATEDPEEVARRIVAAYLERVSLND